MTAAPVDASALPADIAGAIGAAFGGAAVTDLARVGGGLSRATLLSFTVDGAPYIVRKSDSATAPRAFACMQIASDRGIAPRVHYADALTGVAIMDHVDGRPLGPSLPADPARLQKLAATLRRLHDGPAFPRGAALGDALRGLEARMMAVSGEGLPGELHRVVEELAACTARYRASAPCHHDLNPNNVLVTSDRIVFVDWDTASAGDPFLDLAQLGVFGLSRAEERDALLELYLARRPAEEDRARATVARVMALAFYAAAFLLVRGLSGAPPAALPEPLPLPELLRALGTSRERTDPGVVASSLLLEMRRESATPDFAQAKAMLRAG